MGEVFTFHKTTTTALFVSIPSIFQARNQIQENNNETKYGRLCCNGHQWTSGRIKSGLLRDCSKEYIQRERGGGQVDISAHVVRRGSMFNV
jgi:hypothetical protein